MPDPNEIHEDSFRNALLVIRAKSKSNPQAAITLLRNLRNRLLSIPSVGQMAGEWARKILDVQQVLDHPNGAAYILLEDDVVELAKRAENLQIAVFVTDWWAEAAWKL